MATYTFRIGTNNKESIGVMELMTDNINEFEEAVIDVKKMYYKHRDLAINDRERQRLLINKELRKQK